MKKTFIILAVLAAASVASAQNTSTAVSGAVSGAQATVSVALINPQSVLDVPGTTVTVRNTPDVNGPALVSSNDTCMGSTSGAISAPGFGVSLGKTYNDTNCVMLKNSRELWNMGMKAAALALMCNDVNNKAALEVTGFICPQTKNHNQ